MPLDEYASAGAGGALKLKGSKVEKHRKKHKHKHRHRHRLEEAVEAAEQQADNRQEEEGAAADAKQKRRESKKGSEEDKEEPAEPESDPYARMTPAERRFAEAQDQKIRDLMHASPEAVAAARPELFKSHKERLADLNAYLSRMSEHHDMPKIGPG